VCKSIKTTKLLQAL